MRAAGGAVENATMPCDSVERGRVAPRERKGKGEGDGERNPTRKCERAKAKYSSSSLYINLYIDI